MQTLIFFGLLKMTWQNKIYMLKMMKKFNFKSLKGKNIMNYNDFMKAVKEKLSNMSEEEKNK